MCYNFNFWSFVLYLSLCIWLSRFLYLIFGSSALMSGGVSRLCVCVNISPCLWSLLSLDLWYGILLLEHSQVSLQLLIFPLLCLFFRHTITRMLDPLVIHWLCSFCSRSLFLFYFCLDNFYGCIFKFVYSAVSTIWMNSLKESIILFFFYS